jgi:hypothetical protein
MLDIQINQNVLQIFTNLPKINLPDVDAFTYDKILKTVVVFQNGVKTHDFQDVDSERWKDIQKILFAHQFLKYPWASFKRKCIMNPTQLNEELKVTFTKETFVR